MRGKCEWDLIGPKPSPILPRVPSPPQAHDAEAVQMCRVNKDLIYLTNDDESLALFTISKIPKMVNCSGGLFINTNFSWRLVGTQPVVLPNGTTLIQNGASSLTVSKGGYNEFFNAGWGGQTHYYNWGSPANYLAIAIVNGGQYGTRTVVIVDTDAPHGIPTEIVSQVGAPATTPLPILWHCPGAGGAVLVQFMDGQRIGACICTSDTGRAICALPPFRAEGGIMARATDTELQILYHGQVVASGHR